MEKLVTVKDVSERYGCSKQTARKYIRQCNPHMEKPLTTFEWAFQDWEEGRAVIHVNLTLKKLKKRHDRVIVPRKR